LVSVTSRLVKLQGGLALRTIISVPETGAALDERPHIRGIS
jgi:hypothetical protein